MNDWWQGLAPAQAVVECSGNRHRLRWEAGALHALDHGDVEGERTLAALGGQACACLDVIEAWDRHRDDLRVLVLASRGPTDILQARDDPGAWASGGQFGVSQPAVVASLGAGARSSPPASLRRLPSASAMGRRASGWTSYAPLGAPFPSPGRQSQKARAESELVALLGLGGGLPDRLAATVAVAWKARLRESGRPPARSRAQLQAALHGRVFAVMRSWLGASRAESRLVMIGEKGKPRLIPEDGSVRVELPFGWLVDVWAQGLATIWGRFCLSASTDDGRSWKLTTVGPDFGPPSVVTLQLRS
jgi:hypothetical protein